MYYRINSILLTLVNIDIDIDININVNIDINIDMKDSTHYESVFSECSPYPQNNIQLSTVDSAQYLYY